MLRNFVCIAFSHVHLSPFLFRDSNGGVPLHWAAANGHAALVKYLLAEAHPRSPAAWLGLFQVAVPEPGLPNC